MSHLDSLLKKYATVLPNVQKILFDYLKSKRDPVTKLLPPISSNELLTVLNSAGLQQIQDPELLHELYTSSVSSVLNEVASLTDLNISLISPETVKLSVEGTQVQMASISQRALSNIGSIVQESALIPMSLNTMAEKLKTETNVMLGQAKTLVNTGLAQVQRKSLVSQAQEDSLFLYEGANDSATRPFCKAIVGKVFTKKQIAKLNNKQGLGVLLNGGGYNCRHRWLPVSKEYVKSNGLVLASETDVLKANSEATR